MWPCPHSDSPECLQSPCPSRRRAALKAKWHNAGVPASFFVWFLPRSEGDLWAFAQWVMECVLGGSSHFGSNHFGSSFCRAGAPKTLFAFAACSTHSQLTPSREPMSWKEAPNVGGGKSAGKKTDSDFPDCLLTATKPLPTILAMWNSSTCVMCEMFLWLQLECEIHLSLLQCQHVGCLHGCAWSVAADRRHKNHALQMRAHSTRPFTGGAIQPGRARCCHDSWQATSRRWRPRSGPCSSSQFSSSSWRFPGWKDTSYILRLLRLSFLGLPASGCFIRSVCLLKLRQSWHMNSIVRNLEFFCGLVVTFLGWCRSAVESVLCPVCFQV